MGENKIIINFSIEEDLLNQIEDFQFENRFRSRAAAIKWLLRWALDKKPVIKSNKNKVM